MTTNLRIEFETKPSGKTRFMTEAEFRNALVLTLASAANYAGESGKVLGDAAEYIHKLPSDCSWLGTFTTTAEQTRNENLVPAGLECPSCGQDQMDEIEPLDDGNFMCICGTLYSGDTQYGRPSWYDMRPGLRMYFVPTFGNTGRYVSIPAD